VNPVEILPIQDSLILRARGSELLILAHHVTELKQRKTPGDFLTYFRGEALVNRPARKLFEAWVRKDDTLWRRLFHMVHEGLGANEGDAPAAKPEVKSKQVPAPEKTAAKPSKAVEAKSAKPVEKKTDMKSEKKAEKKVEKKVEKAAVKADAKKPSSAAKSGASKTTAKAAPAKKTSAAKPAAKSASGKSTAAKKR